jgi:ABC-type phosphate/phosphonate transport system ATPase subunit
LRWTAPRTAHIHVLHRVALARKYESIDRVAGEHVFEGEYEGLNEPAYRYVYKRPDASNAVARKRKRE